MFHRCLLHLLMSAFNGPAFSAGYRMAVHDVYVHSNTHICPATDGREAFENVPRGLGSSDPAYGRISCSEMVKGTEKTADTRGAGTVVARINALLCATTGRHIHLDQLASQDADPDQLDRLLYLLQLKCDTHLGLAFVSQPCGHVSSEDRDARALAVRMHTTALLFIAISSSPALREMHAMGLRLRCTHGNSRSRRAHLPC